MNSADYLIKQIAQKLLTLRGNTRLRNVDKVLIDGVLSVDIPALQAKLRNDKKAAKTPQ